MFRIFILTIIAGCITLTGIAQEVVVSAGSFSKNSSASISWSLGELVTHTLKTNENIITQGFQQTKLTVTSVDEIPGIRMIVSAFPNPVQENINLKVDGEIDYLKYVVYDLNGRMLHQGAFDSNPMVVPFYEYKSGIYFIRIVMAGAEIQTFKIIKQ
ncbi:MAG: T9SS type A sorting domain-containing protein [Tenuifilaceae bacterium]|jgi:hypothetical protein|nr:T9SS type A sorting domain-containing protein [Tenuifilaceae bacterium]